MISQENAITIFYKDNPQLFFIKENDYREAPETLPPRVHTALDIDEEEYQDFLAQLQGTNYDDTRVDIPVLKDDSKRILDDKEIEKVKTIGKATSAIKKLGLMLSIPITVGMFAYAWVHDKEEPSSPPPPPIVKQIEQEAPQSPEVVRQVMSYSYDKEISKDKVLRSIIRSEGYSELPYPDEKQWSVGHGTEVSRTHTGKTISKSTWQSLEKAFKRMSHSQKKAWFAKHYPNWRSDFYTKYGISAEQQALDSDDGISLANARIAASSTLDELISKMENVAKYDFSQVSGSKSDILKYWKFLPSNVKEAYLDLAYNMGKGFLKKFKNFHKAIALAGDILSQSELSMQDIEYANVFFAEAADQLLYNYNPIEVDDDGNVSGGELKGLTKYHQDLRSSERPQRNSSKIKKGIENPEEYLKTLQTSNFQNESLKRVYSHLFV